MDENLRARARALCAADIAALPAGFHDREAVIERYWPVVAAEIASGGYAPNSLELPADLADRVREYARLRGRQTVSDQF